MHDAYKEFPVRRPDRFKLLGDAAFLHCQLDTCLKAIKHRGTNQMFICIPRGTGSGIYDLYNKKYVGHGFFHLVEDCVFASYYSGVRDVCTVNGMGQIVIYDRYHNDISRKYAFSSVQKCVNYLSTNP